MRTDGNNDPSTGWRKTISRNETGSDIKTINSVKLTPTDSGNYDINLGIGIVYQTEDSRTFVGVIDSDLILQKYETSDISFEVTQHQVAIVN